MVRLTYIARRHVRQLTKMKYIFAALILIIAGCDFTSDTADKMKEQNAREYQMDKGIESLKSELLDPDSYKEVRRFLGPNGTGACVEFRAKNAFGAYYGLLHAVVYPDDGRVFTDAQGDNSFNQIWESFCEYHSPEQIAAKKQREVDEMAARQRAVAAKAKEVVRKNAYWDNAANNKN